MQLLLFNTFKALLSLEIIWKKPEFAYPLLFFSQYTISENAFKKIEASPPLLLY